MNLMQYLKTTALISFMSLLIFPGCNIYQSNGRKNFESKISDSQTQSRLAAQSQLCWNQPSTEALWSLNPEESFEVKVLSENQIQVCMIPSPTVETDSNSRNENTP